MKNDEMVKLQQQQAAANNPGVLFVWQNKPKKRGEKTYSPGAGMSIQVPDMFHIKHTSNNQQTNLSRGLPQNPVTTRDRCVAHMLLRSCRDVRRPWHLPNAIITVLFRRPPDRGGIVKSSKNQTKQKPFFIHTYPGISYACTCRNPTPPANSLFILTWGGVWCRFLVLSSTSA